ncbi:MAG TPA: thiamine pyrophosphate-dependent dehydrogenase E1 component subunit alpha [Puia sp.]|nr:thiamine pyrophosphate-dependent dehydrogenase E1 component subunit alpha [Puia sp.]
MKEAGDKCMQHLYWQMCLIRHTESTLLDMFSKGLLNGTVHTCIGQEACAVGIVNGLDKTRDILFSNHRGHGHYLAYSEDVKGLILEIMGRAGGVCGGVGGSQHLQRDNFYTNGIQASGMPILTGMALAEKQKKTNAVCVSFIGDGTFGEGLVYETFNIASLWQLPVLFVVENNQYAQSTPFYLEHAGDLTSRSLPFGIPVSVADGMDAGGVQELAWRVVEEIRATSRPQLIFLNTYRFAPHSKGDDFRDRSEIEQARQRDPLLLARSRIGEVESRSLYEKAAKHVADIVTQINLTL